MWTKSRFVKRVIVLCRYEGSVQMITENQFLEFSNEFLKLISIDTLEMK